MKKTAKQQALEDIKQELKKEGRIFIAFRSELNVPIRELVKEQLRRQKEKVSFNFTFFSKKVED